MVVERLFGENARILQDRSLHILFAANSIIVLSIAMVSPILETLTGPFAVSATTIGLFVTAVAFPAIFLIPIGGVVADRIGRKPVLLFGLVIFGVSGGSIAFTTDFRVALGLRLFQGVGLAATLPSLISSIRDLYSNAEEATAQGLRVSVTGVSQAIFSTAAGILVGIAWYYPFPIYFLTLPVAVMMYFWFEEPLDLAESSAEPDEDDPQLSYLKEVASLIAHRRVHAILIANMAMFFALFTFYTYNSFVIVAVAGGTAREAGFVIALFSMLFAIVATQAGRITTRFATRTRPLFAAHFLAAVGLSVFVISPHILVAAFGACGVGVGMGILAPMYRSMISSFGASGVRGGIVSAGESLGWFSVTFAPIVVGAVIGVLEETFATPVALQVTVLAVAVLTGLIAMGAIVIASRAPPTTEEERLLLEDVSGPV